MFKRLIEAHKENLRKEALKKENRKAFKEIFTEPESFILTAEMENCELVIRLKRKES